MTIAAFTGHRPHKLGGYDINNPTRRQVRHVVRNLNITGGITGGALGVDQDVAIALADRDIPYIVAAPCRNQWARWPQASRDLYQEICRGSNEELLMELMSKNLFEYRHPYATRQGVIYVYDGDYPGPWVMQYRNEWMVDHGDKLYAFWDGTPGGTSNCVSYADSVGKEWFNLWDQI